MSNLLFEYDQYLQEIIHDEILIYEAGPAKATLKKVIRGGMLVKKVTCPPGFRLIKNKDNPKASRCVKATATQKLNKLRSVKKARITRARNAAKNRSKILLKRSKSMRLRKSRNLK